MDQTEIQGRIIILNGTPRSGKSSIASVIQNEFEGVWMNIGVDRIMDMTPEKFQPSIGLRPGGERPDLEPIIQRMYLAMYKSIVAFSREGMNVIVDVGHHDGYSVERNILQQAAQILNGTPAWLIGVRCPIETVMKRRIETWKKGYTPEGNIPKPIELWQKLVHIPGIYDLEVDTSLYTPEECAAKVHQRVYEGSPPIALQKIRSDN
ncbi:chloramphenicol phosphotransferase [Fictibacillus sp. 23RED33]|uniref:chloramphenicol phosphotransferase CPT family protein n=1 Tax=Fictibacillus sp. 23RED33 TaxID=2745879 RepID=UPI0018CD93DC|nr:chloramphenicol phosphotransferase [Fictibacillus sp. 23RED33]MBH0174317.1 chloramphenicol phosphotransferase [Fictibacillus sp. 23RED33]